MIAPQIPSAISAGVDEVCDRFEDALLRGERPSIDDYLAGATQSREWVLPELVALDLDYRIRAGESSSAAEYFGRFPTLLASPSVAVWLVGIEFRARGAGESPPAESEFRARYPELAKLPEWNSGLWTAIAPETASLVAHGGDTTREFHVAKVDTSEFLKSILAPPDRPGDLGRLGDYHIRSVLGAGGMGYVLKAEDSTLRRAVAIKLMRPEVAATPGAKERFLREARSAAAVEHPRVVIIHHVGQWNGTPYLVMPLMAGKSLAARLKEGPPIPLAEATRITREAADGLAAAHAKGLIHRDIKPDNIWLEETFEGTHVRLLDFGLARGDEAEMLTRTGVVLGTPNYMAPEQAGGGPVDNRSDLFSLGCVLYELLTGQLAFKGTSIISVLNALANHHPPLPRDVMPSVPSPLSDLAMRMLEKSPARRPASAEDVSAELRRIERTLDGNADTVTFASTNPAPSAKSRKLRVALAIVLSIEVSALVYWLSTYDWSPVDKIGPSISAHYTQPIKPAVVAPDTPAPETKVETGPLRVKSIEVQHFATTAEGDVSRGELGRQSFAPLLGDRVQVTAKLSKPAYAYLIAFRPDGVADLCFPADEDTPPPLTDEPKYPLEAGLKAYGLREGTGLWVFAVIASDKPLPAYRRMQERIEAEMQWKPSDTVAPGVVWWDDGLNNVEHLTAGGVARTLRGKDETLEGPTAAIKRLTDSLRVGGRADTASAIGFGVAPRD